MSGGDSTADDDEMLTMRPDPASRMAGSTAWVQRTTPKTLVSNMDW